MTNVFRKNKAGTQVNSWNASSNTVTPTQQTSLFAPYGLQLRQTITSSGAVTIPDGISFVYVIMTGGGGSGVRNSRLKKRKT